MNTKETFEVVLIWGLFLVVRGERKLLMRGASFRASTSFLEYQFPTTSSTIDAEIRVAFSTTRCFGNIVEITNRDSLRQFYKLAFKSDGILTFFYLFDANNLLTVPLQNGSSFCDGEIHQVNIKRFGIRFNISAGKLSIVRQGNIRKAEFSKPDKIKLGGDPQNKFDGCLYDVTVLINHKIIMPLYESKHVKKADIVYGACVSADSECTFLRKDMTMNSTRGAIASPRSDAMNKTGQCSWHLKAPAGRRIKLKIAYFRTEVDFPCFYDYIQLYEDQSKTRDMLRRFCEPAINQHPFQPEVYSTEQDIVVTYRLRKNVEKAEFVAVFEHVNLSEGPCPVNGQLNRTSGNLTIADGYRSYPDIRKCSWTITVPRGFHVLLTFEIDGSDTCHCTGTCVCDYLEARQGSNDNSTLIGRYCGKLRPSPVFSPINQIWIKITTNSQRSHRAFRASYVTVLPIEGCGAVSKILNKTQGRITSPRFPREYPGNLECGWTIRAPEHYVINLTFITPLILDRNCTDVIEVQDGKEKESTLMARYCSTKIRPKSLLSSSKHMSVWFKTDGYINRQSKVGQREIGFILEYTAVQKMASRGTVPSLDIRMVLFVLLGCAMSILSF